MKEISRNKVIDLAFTAAIVMTIFAGAVSAETGQIAENMATSSPMIIFSENFESGWGSWSANNGVWEVGNSTIVNCHGGFNCAATVLNGNYPAGTGSSLISPSIQLSPISAGEEIHLRFWQRFSYAGRDYGQVQVSVYNTSTGLWENWQNVGNSIAGSSPIWSLADRDLTQYAGKKIRIAFFHAPFNPFGYVSTGWYIDDIEITKKVPAFTGDFESGWGDWSANNGVWEVGNSTIVNCHGGFNCAATVLNGNYPAGTGSSLISPSIQLSPISAGEEIHLRFWQWFSYAGRDYGQVQVSVYNTSTGLWENWQNVGNSIAGSSPIWSLADRDLTQYAGKKIRIAFFHAPFNPFGYVSTGWYIDDVQLTLPNSILGDINGDGKLTLVDAIYLAKHVGGFSGYEVIYADGDINCDGKVTLVDAIYLAKHIGGFIGYEKLYCARTSL